MLNFALLANEAASEGVNGGVIAAIILGVIVFIGIIILISCVKVTGQTEKIIVEYHVVLLCVEIRFLTDGVSEPIPLHDITHF